MDDRLTHLVTLGATPDDPVRQPEVDASGEFLLDPVEKVFAWVGSKAQVSAFLHGGWVTVLPLRTRATIALTSERLLFAWPKWKSESTLGTLFERRIAMSFLEREEGKLLLAGHIRHEWVKNVQCSNSARLFGADSTLRSIVEHDDGGVSAFVLTRLPRDAAGELCRHYAALVARHILNDAPPEDEARTALEAIAARRQAPVESGAWAGFAIPRARAVGETVS